MSTDPPEVRGAGARPPRDWTRWRALLVLLAILLAGAVSVLWAFGRQGPELAVVGASCPSPSPTASPLAPSDVEVRVLNSTHRNGLAGRTARALSERGFTIAAVGNAPKPVAGAAEIRFGPAGRRQAHVMALQVPAAALTPVERKGTTVDLVLGGKFDRLATADEITAASEPTAPPTACASPAAS